MNKYSVRVVGQAWGVLCTAADGAESMLGTGGEAATWNMRHQAQDVANALNKWAGCEVEPAPVRLLSDIAADIATNWPKMYFGAEPYVSAMYSLSSMDDDYGADSAETIVRYFLANASSWRGEDARRIKAELKSMLETV